VVFVFEAIFTMVFLSNIRSFALGAEYSRAFSKGYICPERDWFMIITCILTGVIIPYRIQQFADELEEYGKVTKRRWTFTAPDTLAAMIIYIEVLMFPIWPLIYAFKSKGDQRSKGKVPPKTTVEEKVSGRKCELC
jgi:hypothetical protein